MTGDGQIFLMIDEYEAQAIARACGIAARRLRKGGVVNEIQADLEANVLDQICDELKKAVGDGK